MSYDKKASAGRERSANDMAGGKGGQGRLNREEAQRQNGWEDQECGTYDKVYVSEAEMRPMARMANFIGTKGYLIHRSRYQPPEELLKLLWPELEAKLREVINLRKMLSKNDPRRPSDGIYEFLKVMIMLRVVFLQDAPFLMDIYLGHPTWSHNLFTNPAFITWKHHIIQKVNESHRSGVAQGGASAQVRMINEFSIENCCP